MSLAVELGNRDILGDGVTYPEVHGLLHLLLDAAAISDDQDDIGGDQDGHDHDENCR